MLSDQMELIDLVVPGWLSLKLLGHDEMMMISVLRHLTHYCYVGKPKQIVTYTLSINPQRYESSLDAVQLQLVSKLVQCIGV